MRELARDGFPVRVTCRLLRLCRQAYYRWLRRPVSPGVERAAYRANALHTAHREDPEFGYRLLADEARATGEAMAERTAWRLASENGWWCVFGKKRSKRPRPGPAVHDDLCAVTSDSGRVRHEFVASGPNQLWLTDITEHPTAEGKLYACAVKDVFGNKIVGYAIGDRMKASLAARALENAVQMRGNVAGCVFHSDRGSQFRSEKYLRALARHGITGSMGRVGACGDNAAMESFFSLLQKNVLNRRKWRTRGELRSAIVVWTERTYHRKRRQVGLGRLTPVEFETMMSVRSATAA